MKYSTSEFKNGLKVLINDEPYTIIENEFEKPGKGQAFTRIKVRNLLTQKVLEKTYKSGQSIAKANVEEKPMTFLYKDHDAFHFMDQQSYEQIAISAAVVNHSAQWLLEQNSCQILFWNNMPAQVTPDNFIETTVTACEPGVKGDTVTGASKLANICTGASLKVPLFINQGDKIKIDTRNGSYVCRV